MEHSPTISDPDPAAPPSTVTIAAAVDDAAHREASLRAVRAGFLIGLAVFLPCLAIGLVSRSVVLLADAARSGSETLSMMLAWLVVRRARRTGDDAVRLGHLSSLATALLLSVSSLVVLYSAVRRLDQPAPIHLLGGLAGIAASSFSLTLNTMLWRKHRRLAATRPSPVLESQWRLFRAKALVNAIVIGSVTTSLLLRAHPDAWLVDPLSSLALVLVLATSALRVLVGALRGLRGA